MIDKLMPNLKRAVRLLFPAAALLSAMPGLAQWQPAGERIRTVWSEQLDPEHVLP